MFSSWFEQAKCDTTNNELQYLFKVPTCFRSCFRSELREQVTQTLKCCSETIRTCPKTIFYFCWIYYECFSFARILMQIVHFFLLSFETFLLNCKLKYIQILLTEILQKLVKFFCLRIAYTSMLRSISSNCVFKSIAWLKIIIYVEKFAVLVSRRISTLSCMFELEAT